MIELSVCTCIYIYAIISNYYVTNVDSVVLEMVGIFFLTSTSLQCRSLLEFFSSHFPPFWRFLHRSSCALLRPRALTHKHTYARTSICLPHMLLLFSHQVSRVHKSHDVSKISAFSYICAQSFLCFFFLISSLHYSFLLSSFSPSSVGQVEVSVDDWYINPS